MAGWPYPDNPCRVQLTQHLGPTHDHHFNSARWEGRLVFMGTLLLENNSHILPCSRLTLRQKSKWIQWPQLYPGDMGDLSFLRGIDSPVTFSAAQFRHGQWHTKTGEPILGTELLSDRVEFCCRNGLAKSWVKPIQSESSKMLSQELAATGNGIAGFRAITELKSKVLTLDGLRESGN